MDLNNYFKYIVDEIHSTVVATVDDKGLPVTCVVNMMDYDDNGLYFLTARGKKIYDRLKKQGYISLTGIKGRNTMSSVSISIRGKVREIEKEYIDYLVKKNSYIEEIYPTKESRDVLAAFKLYEGSGELFDLSQKPIERVNFTFGNMKSTIQRYFVNNKCIGCKLCYFKCPQKCIDIKMNKAIIKEKHCLQCGNCFEICPVQAIEKRG